MANKVTAPRRWKSSPNSPSTQLAYVTQPEIDLLVDANIHGSMKGKPNKGPEGIISLDGDYVMSWSPPSQPSGGGSSGSQGGGPHQDAPGQPSDYSGLQASIAAVTSQQAQESYQETQNIANQLAQGLTPAQIQAGETVPAGQNILSPVIETAQAIPGLISDWYKSGGWGAPLKLLDKLKYPTVESFQDPKVLAVLSKLFKDKKVELGEEKGDQFKKDYIGEYKKLMDEAFAGNEAMLAQGLSSEKFFDQQLEEASNLSEMGELGKGSQRINFPKEYYLDDGERGIMPQTTGGLEDLAGLDASQYAGTDLAQMIFDARAEQDRMQHAKDLAGGGGAGIPSLYAGPTPTLDPTPDPTDPTPDPTDPTPDPDPIPTTTAPIAPINYADIAPQYTSAYPGYPTYGPAGGPVPNYVNQGLGQWPNFDYWNQIASTFPGMGNYYGYPQET